MEEYIEEINGIITYRTMTAQEGPNRRPGYSDDN
jgi:hypothetical protein